MSNTTNTYGTEGTHHPVAHDGPRDVSQNPASTARPGVDVQFTDSASPNSPPDGEVIIANFPSIAEAEKVVTDLETSGIPRELVTILSDPVQKRNFMKVYVQRDNDRHTHSGTSSAFVALGGAFALGLLGVVIASAFGMMAMIIAAVVGGLLGALLGALLGGMAMRPADDSSIEVVDALAAKDGALVAVRQRTRDRTLDDASRILTRHNARAMRLRPHLSLADLHPGDTRSKAVPEPLHRQP